MLAGLIDIADQRIAEIRSGEKPALRPTTTRSTSPKWSSTSTRSSSR
jgi:hypothetical protein